MINLLKDVIVYAHLKFGALKIICEGYKIRRLSFEDRARFLPFHLSKTKNDWGNLWGLMKIFFARIITHVVANIHQTLHVLGMICSSCKTVCLKTYVSHAPLRSTPCSPNSLQICSALLCGALRMLLRIFTKLVNNAIHSFLKTVCDFFGQH